MASIANDITATILAATQTNPDANYPLDGENLLPVIKGETPIHPRVLFWRYKGIDVPALPSNFLQGAVRNGDWKYVKMGTEEFLFNLATDTKEEIDLRADNINMFEQLRSEYERWSAELVPYPV
ncbi:twin-arginine translocation pathway signal [Calothrix sp. NIES-4071]|nr:twin-arginine translocation pathway signal [Calothrix sp. NIES-4071]BAZ54611.1 twin-arginine translocation pathway signal [Calothrix sp. NIES-4105]